MITDQSGTAHSDEDKQLTDETDSSSGKVVERRKGAEGEAENDDTPKSSSPKGQRCSSVKASTTKAKEIIDADIDDFDREREENIARNKEIIKHLDIERGGDLMKSLERIGSARAKKGSKKKRVTLNTGGDEMDICDDEHETASSGRPSNSSCEADKTPPTSDSPSAEVTDPSAASDTCDATNSKGKSKCASPSPDEPNDVISESTDPSEGNAASVATSHDPIASDGSSPAADTTPTAPTLENKGNWKVDLPLPEKKAAWMTPAIQFLLSLSDNVHWQDLVRQWIEFERSLDFPDGKVSTLFVHIRVFLSSL